jgi:hypothetical protein
MTDANPDCPEQIYARLVGQRDLTVTMLSRRRNGESDLVLGLAATCLERNEEATERDVSARLAAWLAGPGAMLRCDGAELRRWLVDLGYWSRKDGGRSYTRADRSLGEFGEQMEQLAGKTDRVAQSVRQAREQARLARQSRS